MTSKRKQKNSKNKTRGKRVIQKGGFLNKLADFFGYPVDDKNEGTGPVTGPVTGAGTVPDPVAGPVAAQKLVGGKKNKKRGKTNKH